MLESRRLFVLNFAEMNPSVLKFYPAPEELSSVCSKVKCPQDNCTALFQCTSNLNMHLIKHHKVKHSGLTPKNADSQYFCPAIACPYNKDSKKYFTKMKYLKQHFLKVHASKEFICRNCGKKFATSTYLSLHMKNCGKIFSCVCGFYYTSSEAVLTHIRRKGKGHEIIDKNTEINKRNIIVTKKDQSTVKKERLIYPKFTGDMPFPVHYIAAVALSELSTPKNLSKAVDIGIQTEILDFDFNRDQSGKSDKTKNSQQTQTTSGKSRRAKISTHTQTSNDYLKRKGKGQQKTNLKRRKKSMETQTKDQSKGNKSEQSIYTNSKGFAVSRKSIDKINFVHNAKPKPDVINGDEEKARKWLWEMVSSASNKSDLDLMQYSNISCKSQHSCEPSQNSQVNQVFDLNKLCNIETQTDIDALLTECNEDTNFTLCSTTETQTTGDFDCLLYSNMCTQTCEEVDEFFNFNFVHNETQTAWPDLG